MTAFNVQRKIIDRDTAALVSQELRAGGRALVFTNGCFDILHPGHIDLLTKAGNFGDALMVGLNTDASVRRLKGENRPVNDQHSRSIMLAALEVVDWVVLFDEDTPAVLIETVLPSVLVKGGDYTRETVVGHKLVEAMGGRVEIVPLLEGYSTTEYLKKLNKAEF